MDDDCAGFQGDEDEVGPVAGDEEDGAGGIVSLVAIEA